MITHPEARLQLMSLPQRVKPPLRTPTQDDLFDDHLPQSFIPVAEPSVTEQKADQHLVQQRQLSSSSCANLMWPSTGGIPLNEFTTEGYFICAFPTEASDSLGEHQIQVTIGNYFKHLMQCDDGRFFRHPRLHFFILKAEMQYRALQTGQVYVRQNPGDGQLSLDKLQDMLIRGGGAFSS